jgi:hypothetical protein
VSQLLQRYLAGEFVEVWEELGTGPTIPMPREDALTVARAMMRRVRQNIEILEERLRSIDYPFEHAARPSGDGYLARYKAVYAPPTSATPDVLDEVEQLVGALPLSVHAWYLEVGAVNFQSAGYEAMGECDDPLMVSPLEYLLKEAREWLDRPEKDRITYPFSWEFAPDVLHKANVSGGPPYRIALSAPGADGIVEEDTWGQIPFVQYLRKVMEWGGFPGLRHLPPERQHPDKVTYLTRGLLPF